MDIDLDTVTFVFLGGAMIGALLVVRLFLFVGASISKKITPYVNGNGKTKPKQKPNSLFQDTNIPIIQSDIRENKKMIISIKDHQLEHDGVMEKCIHDIHKSEMAQIREMRKHTQLLNEILTATKNNHDS